MAFDKGGNLYFSDTGNHRVRAVDAKTGVVRTVAGIGSKGFAVDRGPATEANFDGPKEICVDPAGNVSVVDTENEAIRRIDAAAGIFSTVTGKGKSATPGLGDGGLATRAGLGRPHGVAAGPDGSLYIGDTNSHRIRVLR